ncbi:hypothetical protein GCM10010211_37860 [Streptomyces albospinus]|uniref:Uncharacterized protein n=1 Tax=Streptomyces albospinus TaxID=285515 RepID=A0ABQ2V4Y7_9ACTN|nr:hypothetical protein GCM10010211_37860 [Streptomyces albospinus]
MDLTALQERTRRCRRGAAEASHAVPAHPVVFDLLEAGGQVLFAASGSGLAAGAGDRRKVAACGATDWEWALSDGSQTGKYVAATFVVRSSLSEQLLRDRNTSRLHAKLHEG